MSDAVFTDSVQVNSEMSYEVQEINGTIEINNSKRKEDSKAEIIPKEEVMEDIPFDHNKDELNASGENRKDFPGGVVRSKSVDLSFKVRTIKDWGYNVFMRTKQKVKEKLNQTSRTVDLDLEKRIEMIKLQQVQYKMMMSSNNRTVEQLKENLLIHQCSSRMFAELAQTDKALSEIFLSQSQSELSVSGHFKDLIDKLVMSTTTLETLVTKTFIDILFDVQAFEISRVEYDAFKTETVKLLSQIQQKSGANGNDKVKLHDMQERLEQKREKYESNKCHVLIKLNLLDDNKTRVIQREILNFRRAWFALHSNCLELYNGNGASLVVPSENDVQST